MRVAIRIKLAKLAISAAGQYAAEFAKHPSLLLDWRYTWHGIEGAAEYVAAVADGDAADDETMTYRVEDPAKGCRSCPERESKPNTLGRCMVCLCPIEGLVAVASKRCPRYRWGPVPVSISTPKRLRK
jgi:hypothetical protein